MYTSLPLRPQEQPCRTPVGRTISRSPRDEGGGEAKLPEGAYLPPPRLAFAPEEEEAPVSAGATSTGAAADAAAANAVSTTPGEAVDEGKSAAATDADRSAGADTHVVGFQGARDQVIVVPQKMTMTLWLLCGDEAKVEKKESWMDALMLTPIFFVSGVVSTCGLVPTLVLGIEDKRWYWLFVAGG